MAMTTVGRYHRANPRASAARTRPGEASPNRTEAALPVARPMNGAEYLETLRDGRDIWIYGEKVDDVTTHPAFRNGVRTIARLYDALHDPATKDEITVPTDTGNGGYTHAFFRTPHSIEDLQSSRRAIEHWARQTWGWMGRSPDYKASFLGTLGGNTDFYAPYEENAK